MGKSVYRNSSFSTRSDEKKQLISASCRKHQILQERKVFSVWNTTAKETLRSGFPGEEERTGSISFISTCPGKEVQWELPASCTFVLFYWQSSLEVVHSVVWVTEQCQTNNCELKESFRGCCWRKRGRATSQRPFRPMHVCTDLVLLQPDLATLWRL